MPREAKRKACPKDARAPRGYHELGGEALAAANDRLSPPDLKEFYHVGPVDVGNGPYYTSARGRQFFLENIWPDDQPPFRDLKIRENGVCWRNRLRFPRDPGYSQVGYIFLTGCARCRIVPPPEVQSHAEGDSMHRLALVGAVGLAGLLLAGPAVASQCPKLVKQIQDATALRFDPTAAAAKEAAAQASSLHGAGRHAESEKMAKDALQKLGIKPAS